VTALHGSVEEEDCCHVLSVENAYNFLARRRKFSQPASEGAIAGVRLQTAVIFAARDHDGCGAFRETDAILNPILRAAVAPTAS